MSERKKVTLPALFAKVAEGTPITWLTCYDYPTAYLQEQAGIDMILVGDSLGMTMLGYDSTLPVTMDDMIRHRPAVRRGAPTAWLVGDMPYMSYQPSVETAIRNAGRFMAEAGCDAVKLEGGAEMADRVAGIALAGDPGHRPPGADPAERQRPGRLPAPGQGRRAGQEDRGRRKGPRGGRRVLHPAGARAGPRLPADHRAGRELHHHEPGLGTRRPRPAAHLPRAFGSTRSSPRAWRRSSPMPGR